MLGAGPTILITGASRGVGLGLVECYAARGWHVIATCRDPGAASNLATLAERHENITIEALDVNDEAAVRELAARYADQPIDVLMNNAGILGDAGAQTAETPSNADLRSSMVGNRSSGCLRRQRRTTASNEGGTLWPFGVSRNGTGSS